MIASRNMRLYQAPVSHFVQGIVKEPTAAGLKRNGKLTGIQLPLREPITYQAHALLPDSTLLAHPVIEVGGIIQRKSIFSTTTPSSEAPIFTCIHKVK